VRYREAGCGRLFDLKAVIVNTGGCVLKRRREMQVRGGGGECLFDVANDERLK
jgi:hypothetical protein